MGCCGVSGRRSGSTSFIAEACCTCGIMTSVGFMPGAPVAAAAAIAAAVLRVPRMGNKSGILPRTLVLLVIVGGVGVSNVLSAAGEGRDSERV